MLIRREFLRAALAGLGALAGRSEDASPFDADVIPAPDDPAAWPAFREQLAQWRARKRAELNYDGRLYEREDLRWTASSFACSFVMLCDEQFYNPREARYQAAAWLEEGQREFGGYDSVVLWHAYPRIGVDDRNQFGMYRDMPGGLAGLQALAGEFHARNVKVYIDYNPWDTGTRREGKPDVDALAELVGAINADGIFLDTLRRGAAELRTRLDAVRPGVALEGEIALPLESVHDHHLSWAQWFRDSQAPGVLRNKWFERRHMQHQIRRWNHDHTDELQMAWMNGSGMMVWENVFGSWVGWTERDKSILRPMLAVQRRYVRLFTGERWTPLVPAEAAGVYASLWEADGIRLWTLVNRTEQTVEGPLLRAPARRGEGYADLIAGRELRPRTERGAAVLEGSIGPRGIGCFLARPARRLREEDSAFLKSQAALQARSNWSAVFPARRTLLVDPPPAPPPPAPGRGSASSTSCGSQLCTAPVRLRAEYGTLPDHGTCLDHTIGADLGPRMNTSGGIDHRRRVLPGTHAIRGMKQPRQPGKSQMGMLRHQRRHGAQGRILGFENDCRRLRPAQKRSVGRRRQKGDTARPPRGQRTNTGDADFTLAPQLTPETLGQFSQAVSRHFFSHLRDQGTLPCSSWITLAVMSILGEAYSTPSERIRSYFSRSASCRMTRVTLRSISRKPSMRRACNSSSNWRRLRMSSR